MKSIKLQWTCSECSKETEIEVSPIIRGVTWGPPENCYPDEGGEADPDTCEHCGYPFDLSKVLDRADSKFREADEDAAERNYDE